MACANVLRRKFTISVIGDLLGLLAILAMLLPWLVLSMAY